MFMPQDKINDIKDRFYEELEHVFDKFPKYHMKMFLGDFNTKVGEEDIFESLLDISNDNLTVRLRCFHIVTFINLLARLLMGGHTIKLTIV
jgi:hypothetical protein